MDILVTTQWLAARLGANDLIIIDATTHLPNSGRDAAAEFEKGHIPGARFLDLASLIDPDSDVPKAVPTADQFARRMEKFGIAHGSRIVLYDDSNIRSSARAWFLFNRAGENNLAILDGGLAKWREEGRELESGVVHHAPRDYPEPDMRRAVFSKQDMIANIDSGEAQIIDARDVARFAGETGSGSEGHIPGAVNVPYASLLNADGTYRQAEEIHTIFTNAGIDLTRPIVTYCNSGVTACVLLFALALVGKEDAALYDGSWMEWGSDSATPKESGTQS